MGFFSYGKLYNRVMNPAEAVQCVREAFRAVPRPDGLFIRGTCRCCECEEHNATLASHDVDSISLKELGNAGWDPMCFASDAAFLYYLPAMFRLAFEDRYYVDQLLFHLNLADRVALVNREQAAAMLMALRAWAELHPEYAGLECYRAQFNEVLRRLDDRARG